MHKFYFIFLHINQLEYYDNTIKKLSSHTMSVYIVNEWCDTVYFSFQNLYINPFCGVCGYRHQSLQETRRSI